MSQTAFHGGKSFEAIGEDFQDLQRAESIINADVLDAWFDPSPRVIERLQRFLPFLARTSPPAYSSGPRTAIAQRRRISEECILMGGGSSHLIFTCLPRVCQGRARAMILDPMYGEYRHVLENLIGIETITFDLHADECFRIDTDRLIRKVLAKEVDVVVLVNPNSPTGQYWPRRETIRFLNSIPQSTLVIIDETYIEYCGSNESIETECERRPNLIVFKSMSKVYALSGMRVGYMVASRETVRKVAKWMPPWAVSLPAQVAAVEALGDDEYYQRRYAETHNLRQELACALTRSVGLRAYPSSTNLVLVEVQTSAQAILEGMQRRGVFVRNCDSMGSRLADRFLRIAVKNREHNERIAEALRAALCDPI